MIFYYFKGDKNYMDLLMEWRMGSNSEKTAGIFFGLLHESCVSRTLSQHTVPYPAA